MRILLDMNDATNAADRTNPNKPAALVPHIGMVALSGNSMFPETEMVLGLVDASELRAEVRERWNRACGGDAGETFVLYSRRGRQGRRVAPRNVWSHTRYLSSWDMTRCYSLRGERPEPA